MLVPKSRCLRNFAGPDDWQSRHFRKRRFRGSGALLTISRPVDTDRLADTEHGGDVKLRRFSGLEPL